MIGGGAPRFRDSLSIRVQQLSADRSIVLKALACDHSADQVAQALIRF